MSEQADFMFAGQSITQAMAAEGWDFGITGIDGEGLLGADLQTGARPGSDGDRLIDRNLPSRLITVSYKLQVASAISHDALTEQARAERLMNGLLNRPGLAQLEFSHQDGYFNAALDHVAKGTRWAHLHTGTLVFYCPQPFLYGPNRTTTPSSGTVSIESNHYVEPVILWETSSQVGAAWIEVDGHRLTIDTGISSGQQIRIDCARKETRVGGALNVENIHGVYPRVFDGSTVETSPGGSLSFQYRERWI